MQCQAEQLLLTLFIDAFILQVGLVAEGAVLLVDLRVFGHDRSCLAVLGISQDQIKGRRSAEDTLTDELFILDEVSLLAVDVRLQKDEASINISRIKQLFDEKQNFIKGQFICPRLHAFLRLKQLGVLDGEEVMGCHLESKQEEWEAQDCPIPLALHLDLKVFECFHHHSIHLPLHQPVNLDRVHSSKHRPICQMQEHAYKLCIFLALHDLKRTVHILLLENKIAEALLWLLLRLLDLLWLLEEGTKGMAISCLLFCTYGKDACWKFLIILLEKCHDLCQLSVDWSLQLLKNFDGKFHLREGEIEDACLIDDFRVFLLSVCESWCILQLVVKLSSEILVEGEDVSRFDVGQVEIQYLQVDLLLFSLLLLVLLGRRRSAVVVDLLLQFHWLQVQDLQHLSRNSLALHLFRHGIIGSLSYNSYRVRMQTTIQPALDDVAIFQRVLLEDLVYVFLGGFDSQIFEVPSGILLLKDLEKGRVLYVQFFTIWSYLDVEDVVLGHLSSLAHTHNNITYSSLPSQKIISSQAQWKGQSIYDR